MLFCTDSDCSTVTSFNADYDVYSPPMTVAFQDTLTCEILKLYKEILPSRTTFHRRQHFIRKMRIILKKEWPKQKMGILVFGSSGNGLSTIHSDIDICITSPKPVCIEALGVALQKHGLEVTKIITKAKVPIAKVWDPILQLACDFNINNTLALQNTKLIKTYVAMDPRVRPLILFIKHWAKQRNIDDAADGGTISTYTWICLVINFLQTRQPPILPSLHDMPHPLSSDNLVIHGQNTSFCQDIKKLRGYGNANYETLGGLLFAFFRKYGFEFDYQQQVISVRSGKILTREEKGWDRGLEENRLLCVEEPFDVQRNLGNSANEEAVKGLVLEFQRAVHVILETRGNLKNVYEAYTPQEYEPNFYYFDNPYLLNAPLPVKNTEKKGRLAI